VRPGSHHCRRHRQGPRSNAAPSTARRPRSPTRSCSSIPSAPRPAGATPAATRSPVKRIMANVGNTVDPSPSRASDALRGLVQTVVDDPTLLGTPRPMSAAGRPGAGGRALGRLADGTPYFAALGELPYDPDEDRVQCHPLREWFRQVAGHHLLKRHGWTVEQYRREFRLAQSVSTCAPGLTAIKSRLVADQKALRAPGRFIRRPGGRRPGRKLGVERRFRSAREG